MGQTRDVPMAIKPSWVPGSLFLRGRLEPGIEDEGPSRRKAICRRSEGGERWQHLDVFYGWRVACLALETYVHCNGLYT
jgi:hypothetical protein